jgi:hypothetical protein
MIQAELKSEITSSVIRALKGEVLPWLVAVGCIAHEEKSFELIFFVSPPTSDQIIDALSCVETEVIADFESDYEISHSICVSSDIKVAKLDFLITGP